MFCGAQCRRFACCPADDEGGCALTDLAFTEICESGNIDVIVVIKRRRYGGRIAR
jgi:hypothetical protein